LAYAFVVAPFRKARTAIEDAAGTVKDAAAQTSTFVKLAVGLGVIALVVAVVALILGVKR
jgi:uncharacterized membrane protein YphA (DoxX/SURF4 family)